MLPDIILVRQLSRGTYLDSPGLGAVLASLLLCFDMGAERLLGHARRAK